MKSISEYYEKIGENFESVKRRLCDDEMIKRFVLKFGKDGTFSELSAAMTARELPAAFREAHTLKGVAANLGFAKLAFSASELTEILRSGTFDGADEAFLKTKKEYLAVAGKIDNIV